MGESKLRILIGLFVVLSHLTIIVLVLVFFVMGGLLFKEMTTTIALVAPMFSIYTTAIIKYIVANKGVSTHKDPPTPKAYVFISFLLPVLFVVLVASAIALKAYNIAFSSFEQFTITLSLLESVVGIYMGVVLTSMFDVKRRKSSK